MEEEQVSNDIPPAQLDGRWFKPYRSIVSFDLFAWLAIAGPFTEGERREWDQLFGREDDEARKRMATLIATSRDRELGLALEERLEPRLRYPAIPIDTVRQKTRELQRFSREVDAGEPNGVVRRLYLDAIEEQVDVLLMVEATYHGDARAFAYYNSSVYALPSPREMDFALDRLLKQLQRGTNRPETARISAHLLDYLPHPRGHTTVAMRTRAMQRRQDSRRRPPSRSRSPFPRRRSSVFLKRCCTSITWITGGC